MKSYVKRWWGRGSTGRRGSVKWQWESDKWQWESVKWQWKSAKVRWGGVEEHFIQS